MVNCYSHSCLYNNINFNDWFIMQQITNTIEVEYEHFILEVNYDYRKGHAGNYFNPPEPDEIDIQNVFITGYINDDGSIENLDNRKIYNINNESQKLIVNEISYDVENFI